MAVVRAHEAKIPVVLSSATPSVETEVNARRGRYRRLNLPERFGGQHLPHDRSHRSAARRLRRAAVSFRRSWRKPCRLRSRRGGQALLFLNRRGYAPLTLCRACGFRLSCPNCDAWLVDHRFKRRLVCHHCGFAMPPPAICPKCEAEDSFAAVGPGVERLNEEVGELFPRRARDRAVQRSGGIGRTPARGARRRRARASSTSSSAPSSSPRAIISRSSIWSALSMPISALPTAIRAPPSAASSF